MRPDKDIRDFFKDYRDKALLNTLQQRLAVHRNVGQQRQFLKGEAADWYDPFSLRWKAFEDHPKHDARRIPKYRYHLNIYQYGWKVLQGAIQTTGILGSVFVPQSGSQQADRDASRIAKTVADYERSVIDFQKLQGTVWRYFYTDGIVLGYTRHIPGNEESGTIRSEVDVPAVVREAGYECPMCKGFTESGMTIRNERGGIHCPQCGEELHAGNFSERQMGTERQTQIEEVPKGFELVSLYGALECPLPWWTPELRNCPYIPIEIDIPTEQIFQAFPDLRDEIKGHGEDSATEGRTARVSVRTPTNASRNPGTENFSVYGRWWIQPQAFHSEDDEGKRKELLTEYPKGAFVQFCDSLVLDAVPESYADHVTLARAMDGDGMYTPSLGQNGVPVQESTNTSFNMQIEAQEYASFPPILVDRATIDPKALEDTQVKAGLYKFIVVPPGKTMDGCMKQIVIKESSVAVNMLIDNAPKWMELLVGTSPALAGGQMTNTRSAQQYSLSKNQALQQLATPYEATKVFFAKIDEILVHEFLSHRTDEEFQEIVSEKVNPKQVAVMLAPRQGRVYSHSEQSESIPQTWAQQQTAIQQLLQSQSPQIQEWLADPNNLSVVRDKMALPGLTIPGAKMQEKVKSLIPQLLAASPTTEQGPNPEDPDGPPVDMPSSSIPFDPLFDDPRIILRVVSEWSAEPNGSSFNGLEAQRNNGKGYENLKLYVQAAAMAMAQATSQPAPEPDPTKMASVQLQEETKRAVAKINTASQEAQEQMESDTDRWLQIRQEEHERAMQRVQVEHEASQPQPAGGAS